LLGRARKPSNLVHRHDPHGIAGANAHAGACDERVREVRRQIAAGTYLTDEKLEAAADCLWDVLNEGHGRIRRATA
jgi:hypothetical protein